MFFLDRHHCSNTCYSGPVNTRGRWHIWKKRNKTKNTLTQTKTITRTNPNKQQQQQIKKKKEKTNKKPHHPVFFLPSFDLNLALIQNWGFLEFWFMSCSALSLRIKGKQKICFTHKGRNKSFRRKLASDQNVGEINKGNEQKSHVWIWDHIWVR